MTVAQTEGNTEIMPDFECGKWLRSEGEEEWGLDSPGLFVLRGASDHWVQGNTTTLMASNTATAGPRQSGNGASPRPAVLCLTAAPLQWMAYHEYCIPTAQPLYMPGCEHHAHGRSIRVFLRIYGHGIRGSAIAIPNWWCAGCAGHVLFRTFAHVWLSSGRLRSNKVGLSLYQLQNLLLL